MRSAACLILMTAISLPAQAQPPSEIEGIIVRGELLERSLQDTQTSVSVITGEELDRSVHKDLFDVIDRIPGAGFAQPLGCDIPGQQLPPSLRDRMRVDAQQAGDPRITPRADLERLEQRVETAFEKRVLSMLVGAIRAF